MKILIRISSPKTCYHLCRVLQPWVSGACLLLLGVGIFWGLWLAPTDYQQGDAYRIIYLHVPAAILSLAVYVFMTVFVVIYFIWKIKIADLAAKACAPLGVLFTGITLITGMLWGKPMWGTFWIWDARLTSELILLFIYVGIMALRSAIPHSEAGARASGILTLMGVVNIPIVHYSVNWWNTLHQGATLLRFGAPRIALSMLYPLLIMIAAYFFYCVWMGLLSMRYELLTKEKNTAWVKQLRGLS